MQIIKVDEKNEFLHTNMWLNYVGGGGGVGRGKRGDGGGGGKGVEEVGDGKGVLGEESDGGGR